MTAESGGPAGGRRRAAALALLLFAGAARAQDEGIGVADSRGSFYSVTNRRGPSNLYFQVTKLALGGAIIFNIPFDPRADVQANVATVDREGNLLVAGTVLDRGKREVLVAKFNPYGNLVWRQAHDAGGSPIPTALAADAEGHVYVASSVSEPGGSFLRMLRYGPMGAFFWGQSYRGGRTTYARAITIDPNGDARVTTDSTFQNYAPGYTQVRQVVFTASGGVAPQ